MTGTVVFVGAGPGDPELLTIKGQRCIMQADLVLYAGSLVPHAVIACAGKHARVVDSSPLTLEQCHILMRDAAVCGQSVARVHTGDPSLYGTIREQIHLLDADGIPWRVIPGVTSACAAAAAAGIAFTVPHITQSLILTRISGRTPTPERERLRALAAHQCSIALYLSAHEPETVREELLAAVPAHTPVLCAYRVGWPEQALYWTTVDALPQTVREYNLGRQTILLVLPGQNAPPTRSRLYAPDFSHAARQGGSCT